MSMHVLIEKKNHSALKLNIKKKKINFDIHIDFTQKLTN